MLTHLCKYNTYFQKIGNLLIFLVLFLFSSAATVCAQSMDYLMYIEQYSETAVRHQQEYGIPASITLAQGLLESGAGKSRLAVEGNNHFGIKCHSTWKGDVIHADDDELNECFRKYDDAAESFEDHARFLMKKRYAPLFELKPTDYKGWAKGLKKCGYATDPSYASKLINIIETYELYVYDTGQPVIASRKKLQGDEMLEHSIDMEIINEFKLMHKMRKKWGLYYITVYEGDTYDAIAEEFGIKKRRLLSFNDLGRRDEMLEAGSMLYLEEKNDCVETGPETHKVKKGDTPYSIAQEYGIKLESFLKMNGLEADDRLRAGKKLRLR